MSVTVGPLLLRAPEPADVEAMYAFRNDRRVTDYVLGSSTGYSRADLADWIERRRAASDEVVWVIAMADTDACIGHVGLYRIDHRIGSAEFGILIGDADARGRGHGRAASEAVITYGFDELSLNRIELSVLDFNSRARKLYESLGFVEEGVRRQAQYRNGAYCDVVVMGLLRADHRRDGP